MGINQDTVHFVKGMFYHDIAKPFWLGNNWHTIMGFAILQAIGLPEEESLVALLHSRRFEQEYDETVFMHNMRLYFDYKDGLASFGQQWSRELPAYLALATELDKLAASTYSFMDEDIRGKGSIQNPFSRLPMEALGLGPLKVKDGPKLANDVFRQALKEEFTPDGEWGNLEQIRKQLRQKTPDPKGLSLLVQALRKGKIHPRPLPGFERLKRTDLLNVLKPYYETFVERTYPPVNDTAISHHGRLSAVLAYVLHENLVRRRDPFLGQRITRGVTNFLLGGKDIETFYAQDKSGLSEAERLVAKALDCWMVRLSLTGFEDMFANAARLDDLHGLRATVAMLKSFLKVSIASELGARDLADMLPLSETPFDLIYLLPDFPSRERVETLISGAYESAMDALTDELLRQAQDDFRQVENLIDFWPQRENVRGQLLNLMPELGLAPIKVQLGDGKFTGFKRQFAKEMLGAFKAVFAPEATSIPKVYVDRTIKAVEDVERLPYQGGELRGEVCAACGANSIWPEFVTALAKSDYFRKVVHEFRGEPEKLCVSCISMRVLSHMQVQVPSLHKLFDFNPDDGWLRLKSPLPQFPDVPPALRVPARLDTEGDFADLGAAFARRRGDRLQIFPTISYAADENSNVALIEIRPNWEQIFATYDQTELFKAIDKPSTSGDWGDFKEFYLDICKKYEADKDVFDEIIKVQPHVARVLQRIAAIDNFYGDLSYDLEEPERLLKLDKAEEFGEYLGQIGGVRVLPIETRYPNALLMVPASRLIDALTILQSSVTIRLFSAMLYSVTGEKTGWPDRNLLGEVLPQLLHASVVVIKQKQPLYMALAVSGRVIEHLRKEGEKSWRGVLFGLSDLRGVMSERAWVQAKAPYIEMFTISDLANQVDRFSLIFSATLRQQVSEEVGAARLQIRGHRQHWGPETMELLQDKDYFDPTLFLKVMARR